MRKHLVVLVGLACVGSASIASADGPTLTRAVAPLGSVTPDDADLVPRRKRAAVRRTAQEKYLAVAKADPRFEQAKADLVAASKITDLKERKVAMKAAGTKWTAFRTEMLKKANIDVNAVKAQLAAIPLLKASPVRNTALVANMNNIPTTLTASSFPEQFTFKKDCTDGGDTWTFYGEKTNVKAFSTVTSGDCGKVGAGKGARFELPAGVKRVEVTAEWIYGIDASALTYGIYGHGYAATGLRIKSLAGATLSTQDMPHGPVNFDSRTDNYISVDAECDVLTFCEDSNAGTARMTIPFDIDKPGGLVVTPYVSAGADADLHANAHGSGDILDVKSITVKVYK